MPYKRGILDLNVAPKDEKEIYIICVPIGNFSPTIQFILLSIAVFLFYLAYGYVLELIFTLEGIFSYGWYITLVQFGFYSLFSVTQLITSKINLEKRIDWKTYMLIASLTVGTMGFSNSAMGYLNYPTQVIFKSCKLIPVMVGSVIILKKYYNIFQVLACIFMSLGLIWFTLADNAVDPDFNFTGITLISLALLCDAVIGNVQEKSMKECNEHILTVIFYSYSIGFVLILMSLLVSNTFFDGFMFSLKFPWAVYGRCALLSLAGYFGLQVVLVLIREFGAVAAVTVTTFRKALSICLSFIFFAKPFTVHYLFGGFLVTLGICLNVLGKNKTGLSIVSSAQIFFVTRFKYWTCKNIKKQTMFLDV